MSFVTACLATVLSAFGAFVARANPEIHRVDFQVASDPGIALAVREVVANGAAGDVPVVLLHGARVPGVASFDLPVEGGSVAADLARAGHRVFIMDARGYGGSTRPMQDGTQDGPALARSSEVVRDVGAVIEAVAARTGVQRVALVGWATGGHWAGMYASQNPARISHLVMSNSLYGAYAGHRTLGPGSEISDPDNPERFNAARFGAYRLNTAASLLPAWDKSIPADDKSVWRDPAIARAYQEAALASDPTSPRRNPAAFRAPSGAMADSFELAAGRKLWDARTITARVLLIRAENDFWSRPEDVTTLQADLVNAESVRAVTIPQATHFVHLDRSERGRDVFLTEVTRFLRASPPPPGR